MIYDSVQKTSSKINFHEKISANDKEFVVVFFKLNHLKFLIKKKILFRPFRLNWLILVIFWFLKFLFVWHIKSDFVYWWWFSHSKCFPFFSHFWSAFNLSVSYFPDDSYPFLFRFECFKTKKFKHQQQTQISHSLSHTSYTSIIIRLQHDL